VKTNVCLCLCLCDAGDMNTCYILDGILVLYGIILTVLYCRLRVRGQKDTSHTSDERFLQHVYILHLSVCVLQGLTTHTSDTYETIKMEKKPMV
uniref:Uncharacterized protein n=1 Tax=Salarias fasciatus TaxID=181472 RepID=A0A672ILW8_SALFA